MKLRLSMEFLGTIIVFHVYNPLPLPRQQKLSIESMTKNSGLKVSQTFKGEYNFLRHGLMIKITNSYGGVTITRTCHFKSMENLGKTLTINGKRNS